MNSQALSYFVSFKAALVASRWDSPCISSPYLKLHAASPLTPAINGLLIFAVWLLVCFTAFRQPITARVSALLAGLPLLDWIGLLPISLWMLDARSNDPLAQHSAIISLALAPIAFILSRLLQRLSPAT